MVRSIEPLFDKKYITWECTTVCNYSCSYCPPACHDGRYRWPDLDQTARLLQFIDQFREEQQVIIDIMGGEPTLWPHLQQFCSQLPNDSLITFSSNGSRTARWWSQFNAPIGHLLFSYHPEEASLDHYLEILAEVHEKYRTTVLILFHPNYKEKCLQVFDALKDSGLKIGCSLKGLWGVTYDEADTQLLLQSFSNSELPLRDMLFEISVDGEIYDKVLFIKQGLNRFKGWQCNLGENYRYIRANGDVYGAACGLGLNLGNVYTDEIKQPVSIICPLERCDCLPDMALNSKYDLR